MYLQLEQFQAIGSNLIGAFESGMDLQIERRKEDMHKRMQISKWHCWIFMGGAIYVYVWETEGKCVGEGRWVNK